MEALSGQNKKNMYMNDTLEGRILSQEIFNMFNSVLNMSHMCKLEKNGVYGFTYPEVMRLSCV